MNKNYIILLITLLTLISCGKSKEQLELEKIKLELVKAKIELSEKESEGKEIIQTEKNLNSKIESERILKIHEQKVNVGKQKKLTELEDLLSRANISLTKAEQSYKNLNEFQFGRAQSEKDIQIQNVLNQINESSTFIRNIKNEIAELELSRTFNFQKSPEGVVKHLFLAAKNKDFSKLRYLSDPYGEDDGNTKRFTYAGMLPQKEQDQFVENFENGRIIGTTIIKGDKAVVEFAGGAGADQLAKMTLVNRMGSWFLFGL